MFSRAQVFKIISLIILIIVIIWINRTYLVVSPQDLRDWIVSFGWYAPVLYIILYTFRTLILFPSAIFNIAAGLAFGAALGTLYTVVGSIMSGVLAFWVSRMLAKGLVDLQWKGTWYKVQRQMEENGFVYVLILRFIPVMNFDLVSYAAGASKIRFLSYFWGTSLGIVPATFAYSFLGSSVADPEILNFVLAGILFIIVLLVPLLFGRRIWKEVD